MGRVDGARLAVLPQGVIATPDLASLDWWAIVLCLVADVSLFRLHAGVIKTLVAYFTTSKR